MNHTLNIDPTDNVSLTGREKECLVLLAKGLRTKSIAYELGIKDVTVTFHIKNAKTKLSAQTPVEAATKAFLLGLIDPKSC